MNTSDESFENLPDEELARLFLAGRVEVFASIFHRYYARTYRLAFGMTGSHETAEDLTQEVFLRAFRKLVLFDGKSRFSTWFYRLTFNHCLNYRQSRGFLGAARSTQLDPEVTAMPSKSMEKTVLEGEIQGHVHKALLGLKPNLRLLVILKDIEGLGYDEIADRLNCSVGTLAVQLHRARKQLARKLEHLRGAL